MKRLIQTHTPLEAFVLHRVWDAFIEEEARSSLCYLPMAQCNTFKTRRLLQQNPAYRKLLPNSPMRTDDPIYDVGASLKFCTLRMLAYRNRESGGTDVYVGSFSTFAGQLIAVPMVNRFLTRIETASPRYGQPTLQERA